jgi:hypothetical protein
VNIEIRVDATAQPDRIALNVAPGLRIVVAEVVVEQPRLGIEVLAGQYSNRPLPQRAVFRGGTSEGYGLRRRGFARVDP